MNIYTLTGLLRQATYTISITTEAHWGHAHFQIYFFQTKSLPNCITSKMHHFQISSLPNSSIIIIIRMRANAAAPRAQ